MPKILSGRECRDALLPELEKRVRDLPRPPELAIIQVGDRPDSSSYIRAKTAFAKKIGVTVNHIKIPDSATEKEILSAVQSQNKDDSVCGVIVQLPLPDGVDPDRVTGAVLPLKDVDGLTSGAKVTPATARGVKMLLDFYGISLKGKNVTVIGRSKLVGGPIADMCRSEGAMVTVCHRGTVDLVKETSSAHVIIVAAGKPNLIRAEHVRAGQVIIDVGINTVEGEILENEIKGKKIVGDVASEEVSRIIGDDGAISPVPGGVGPMTVLALFENLADLCASKYN